MDLKARAEARLRALDAFAAGADPAPLYEAALGDLRRALWASPYWREALRAAGGSPDDLRAVTDLAHVPPIDRATWAARWEDLAGPGDDLVVVTSSGTTGRPVPVVRDGLDQRWPQLLVVWWASRHGVRLERPRIAFVDVLGGDGRDGPLDLVGGDVVRVHDVRRLRDVRADVLSSDPPGLAAVLDAPRDDVPEDVFRGVRLVLSSAQHLPRDVRERLPAPVVDDWAATETGPIAWSCPLDPDAFHVLGPHLYVEDADGELVVSRLTDSAMPALRWRSGDRGRVAWEACACGVHGQVVRGLVGRSPCWFAGPLGPVDASGLVTAFRGRPWRAFRVTQLALDRYLVELEGDVEGVGGDVPPSLAEDVRRRLAELGLPGTVDVRRVPSLGAGKPRPLVSLVRPVT